MFLLVLSCRHAQNDVLLFDVSRGDFLITTRAEGELEAKKAHTVTMPMLRSSSPKISKLTREGTLVKKGDVVVVLEAEDIQRRYLEALDEVEIARADAEKTNAQLKLQRSMLEAQVKSLQATVQTSRLQLAKLAFEPDRVREARRLEIQRDEIELEKNKNKLDALEKIQKEERAHAQLKIKQAQSTLDQAFSFLQQLELKAPVNGIVIHERSWLTGEKIKEGDQLWSRMPIVKIPDLTAMQALLHVGETDARKIKKEMQAVVHVPTLEGVRLDGRVTRIDKMAKPINRGSKVKKIDVVVEIDTSFTGLVPGLSVFCDIMIERKTDVLTVPRECLFEKDSVKIIYQYKNGTFYPAPVAVMDGDENFAVISGELGDNLRLALTEPSYTDVEWPAVLKPFSASTTDSAAVERRPDGPSLKEDVNI